MKSLSLLTLSCLSFGLLVVAAKPADAGWIKSDGNSGPVCIVGSARGPVGVQMGTWDASNSAYKQAWSTNFNANEVRKKSTFGYSSQKLLQLIPVVKEIDSGLSRLSRADRFVSHIQKYNVQVNVGSDINRFYVSDSTATVNRDTCKSPFTVRM